MVPRDLHTRLLVVVCAVLAAAVAITASLPLDLAQRLLPGAGPASDAARVAPPLALPALAALTETTTRPIFTASRRAEPQGTPVRLAPGAARSDLILGRYRLVGVIASGSRTTLKLQPVGGGKIREIGPGDTLDDWTVEAVTAQHLTLRSGANRERISLTPGRRR